MHNLLVMYKLDLRRLLVNKVNTFYGIFFPILLTVILSFLFKDSYGNGLSSLDYYGITIVIYSMFTSGMTAARTFMEGDVRKANMRIAYSPGGISTIFLSKIASCFTFSYVCHVTVTAVLCLFFGVHISETGYVLIIYALTEFAAVTFGIMCCCAFKSADMADQILNIFVNLFAFMGGLVVPLDGYGKAARVISNLSPAKWVLVRTLSIIYDHSMGGYLQLIVGLVIVIGLELFICKNTFREEDCLC